MKKVLIITYYWPPAGGPGVQRWLKFVKYLPDFGVHPVVYVPKNPTYPLQDSNLISDIDSNRITVLKQKIFEPYAMASFFSKKETKKISSGIIAPERKQTFAQKALLWIRGNFFIPDARVFWVKPSVAYLSNYIKEQQIETVITTGPPHSLHLIGLQLKKQMPAIKWIADFRDPWTTIGYYKDLKLSASSHQKHKKLEQQVLNKADQIVVTSAVTKAEFAVLTPKPIAVITNGYDTEPIPPQELDIKFSLAHIGSFLSKRNPRIFWKAITEILKEDATFKEHFELKLIGAVSQEIIDTIDEFKLTKFTRNLGYISHQDAVVEQRKSQVLLLIEIDSDETKCIIPGKLFEYMVSYRPILAIGPEDTDVEQIIKETNTGVYTTYDEKHRIKETIKSYYALFLANKLHVYPEGLARYSRKNLTKKLTELL
ncbi:glycosyltransferase [Flavobacterium agricola]|uniref:Glycosyltransferase n=1 Tax=Flavobacterium agricola TaxID=2870839 RepID=A0ABY6LXQ4_9FLAO|nr:glycosyltransferase [Flavobacterium agricola]UYW01113.1 glycosyltransferase [Flavobacterium agricola]